MGLEFISRMQTKTVNKIKSSTFLNLLFGLIEGIKIKYFHNNDKQPIFVYQMGKVGSSTVSKTLEKLNINNSIFHVHFLSDKNINDLILRYKNLTKSIVPMHLIRSKYLVKKFDLKKDKIKIITLTREPVGRIVSDFFQNIYYESPELIYKEDKINYDIASEKVKDRILKYDIENEYAATWFEKEFKEALGIDVYNFEFHKEKGYQIIKSNNVECLILKMEKLNEVGIKAINEFLFIEGNGALKQSNISSKKEFAEDQKKLKYELHFDKKILQHIYSSQYMKHFYTDEEISSFIKKWL